VSGKVFFVSGIDTGIGKTMATGLMARSLAAAGHDVITVKLVQTGNDGFSEDIDAHRAICGGARFPEDGEGLTAPQIFKFPSSPLLAAALEGRTVDVEAISRAVRECAARHEIVLVESAGGLDVPLTEDMLSVDLAAREGWPLVLVSCGRLGSINHTLLSLEEAKARGMLVAGVVWNWCEGADSRIDDDSCETIRRYLLRWGFPPIVVSIPRFDVGGPYPEISLSGLFDAARGFEGLDFHARL
jgi:dethiobiotin synthetase